MPLSQSESSSGIARPVVLGTGLTGLAISRTLSASGIDHVLVGSRPTDAPRLGESLNAEGSLEIQRQFPELSQYFFTKRRVALFYDGLTASFDSLSVAQGRAMFAPLEYPATVNLLHVDRVGFDGALFASAIQTDHCLFAGGQVAELEFVPEADRVSAVTLASGESFAASYVFDATNHARVVARKIGVPYRQIGAPRRVVFAHYHGQSKSAAWQDATSLVRLDVRTDTIDGLAWCIPLGDYVSLGISVHPDAVGANPSLLLDLLEKAYARRGIDVRSSFRERGTPADFGYEHYSHARCYGRNWLLAGPSCCQIWFPAAAGVATGLIAARLAPDILRAPAQVGAFYQGYMDGIAASHGMLEWTVSSDPWSVGAEELGRRSRAMVDGNVRRLGRYLELAEPPAELAFGDALTRFYESDRRLANPLRIDAVAPGAQATRLFASGPANPWVDAPISVPVLTRPDRLAGPTAILAIIDILSGQQAADTSGKWLADDFELQIDQFNLHGVAQWVAWVDLLRTSTRVASPELVASALSMSDHTWTLTGQWQAASGEERMVSPTFSIAFTMAGDQIATIRTSRADYTFVTGDVILPAVAFAALLSGSTESRPTKPAPA
jgi:flavin-dependent dehydrogenase